MITDSNKNSSSATNHAITFYNQEKIGHTPLHNATIINNLVKVHDLLKNGADPNVQDVNGNTPLHFAVEMNWLDIVMALLNNHADPNVQNKYGQTTLHLATEKNNLDAIKILVNSNVVCNIQDLYGLTSLHHATIHGNMGIMLILLENKADPNIQDSENCWTSLHHATMGSNLEGVSALLKYNADVNIQDKWGQTPLRNAIMGGNLEIFLALVGHNADVNILDNAGLTPLHYAAKEGKLGVVKALLDNNADVNIRDINGQTALHWCKLRPFSFLKEHVIKLKISKLSVCNENLNLVYNSSRKWESECVEKVGSLCHEELIKMKREKIGDSFISFYKFMVVDFHTRVNYLNNESMIQILMLVDWKVKFPLYANILQSRFTEAFKRSELLREARHYGGSSIFQRLPVIFIDRIYSFLSNNELKTLNYVLKLASSSDNK